MRAVSRAKSVFAGFMSVSIGPGRVVPRSAEDKGSGDENNDQVHHGKAHCFSLLISLDGAQFVVCAEKLSEDRFQLNVKVAAHCYKGVSTRTFGQRSGAG